MNLETAKEIWVLGDNLLTILNQYIDMLVDMRESASNIVASVRPIVYPNLTEEQKKQVIEESRKKRQETDCQSETSQKSLEDKSVGDVSYDMDLSEVKSSLTLFQ